MNRGVGERPAWHAWYDLAVWQQVKDHFRARQPMRACICQAQDAETGKQCTRPATDIDHIQPHKGDWFLFCGGVHYENLQGLCHRHHSEKTAKELSGKKAETRRVVAWAGSVPIYEA